MSGCYGYGSVDVAVRTVGAVEDVNVAEYERLAQTPRLEKGSSGGRLGGPIEWLVETPAEIALHAALVIPGTKGVTPRLVAE